MAVWQCRLLLGIVLVHLALSSPSVRRDVLSLTHETDSGPNPLSELQPESLSEDAFGPTLEKRGGREKRLLKTLGIGALGVKAAKAVGTKVVAAGAKAVGAKVLKTGAAVKAATLGAVGLKAKAIGAKAVTAVVALGIKALIFKLLFGKINQLITHKERLLHQLDEYNRVQNEKFSKQLFGVPPCNHQTPGPAPSYPTVGPAPAPAANPDTVYTLPNFESGGEATFSPDPIPQDQGYVYRRRR
ncbi:uncharacterized protein LOC124363204 [Homalodisca vitripennis]|uniref:uncharacterized protein LOC124363204 n=1 Tax=Homalodisca vitripennis TaxID=197043 RepID=UPI001EEB68C7|nr:uncharacterized protein LOC124363204 [Homalodisca vitripennis]